MSGTIKKNILNAIETVPLNKISLGLWQQLEIDQTTDIFKGLWGQSLDEVKKIVKFRVLQRKGLGPNWDEIDEIKTTNFR